MAYKTKKEKTVAVENLLKTVEMANLILFVDYRGLSVTDITELKKKLYREAQNAQMKVVKNSVIKIVFNQLNMECSNEILNGPCALVTTSQDVIGLSKIILDYNEQTDKLLLKGGFLFQKSINAKAIQQLAKLPGREVLLSKLVTSIKVPITNLVMCISNPLREFIYILNNIKEKKSGGEL